MYIYIDSFVDRVVNLWTTFVSPLLCCFSKFGITPLCVFHFILSKLSRLNITSKQSHGICPFGAI